MHAPIVIDTNILLDCFVFKDKATLSLQEHILEKNVRWIATLAMEQEYVRVLTYPNVARWVERLCEEDRLRLDQIFALYADVVEEPSQTDLPCVRCRDRDDQIFIDLALAHEGVLLSKDLEVLKLKGKKGLHVVRLDAIEHFLQTYTS